MSWNGRSHHLPERGEIGLRVVLSEVDGKVGNPLSVGPDVAERFRPGSSTGPRQHLTCSRFNQLANHRGRHGMVTRGIRIDTAGSLPEYCAH